MADTTVVPSDAISVFESYPDKGISVAVWMKHEAFEPPIFPGVGHWTGHQWLMGVPNFWLNVLSQGWRVTHWKPL